MSKVVIHNTSSNGQHRHTHLLLVFSLFSSLRKHLQQRLLRSEYMNSPWPSLSIIDTGRKGDLDMHGFWPPCDMKLQANPTHSLLDLYIYLACLLYVWILVVYVMFNRWQLALLRFSSWEFDKSRSTQRLFQGMRKCQQPLTWDRDGSW